MMDFKTEFSQCRDMVERELENYFRESVSYSTLLEAMRYSLLAGGKRIRPVIAIKFCEACGGKAKDVLPLACAVEMLHTYSLIHDDLPCMDNDTIRRGKPTNHVVFGEWTALLAGDALLTEAFKTILSADVTAHIRAEAGRVLSESAGAFGMCGGQYLDMKAESEEVSLEVIEEIHSLKTAALIRASACIGVIAASGTQQQYDAAVEYANAVGLAFQIRDDLLDMTSTSEEMGKTIGKDAENGKITFASVYGEKRCEEFIDIETEKAKKAVKSVFSEPCFLMGLADMLAKRRY